MSQGWIKLHREIRDHWIFKENRTFSKYEAWTDLLLDANHKDNAAYFNKNIVEVKRGQTLTSEVKLSEKWNWSRKKVRNFLKLLEEQGMITKITVPKRYVIVQIANYDRYQNRTTEDTSQDIVNTYVDHCVVTSEDTTREQQGNNRGTTEEQQGNINKNVKNVKNVKNEKNIKIKNKYAEFVSMTEEEYKKLVDKHGDILTKRMITALDNYKGSKGKTYKSDYRAILSWVVDKVLNENKKDQSYNNKSNKKDVKTKFHNFEQRSDKYTAKELEQKLLDKYR